MKKLITKSQNRHLIRKWRMATMNLLSLALIVSSGFLPLTAGVALSSSCRRGGFKS